MSEQQPQLSFSHVLKVVIPVAIVVLLAYLYSRTWEPAARDEGSKDIFARILTASVVPIEGAVSHSDSDGDLVADSPEDAKACITPEVLTFSFVGGDSEKDPSEMWQVLLAALKEKTGKEVKFVEYSNIDDQLAALNKGELHLAVLNTGNVPVAVKRDGYVPLCTFGHEDGSYGITMQLLVPADSPLKDVSDVKGHKVTFTRPDSNSGCKALVVFLKEKKNLLPERDYTWQFSAGHDESIKGIAEKKYEAAPVASDYLIRMVKNGEVDPKAVRQIYESERFPPATIGYVYNLSPELRTAIRESLIGLSLKGTPLEGEFGGETTKLVPVDFKKDWDSARQIDQFAASHRAKKDG